VSFFDALLAYARAGHVVWMVPAWVAVVAAVKRWAPDARRRVWPSTVLLILAALLVVWGATADALGYDDRPIAAAALAFELLAVVGLAQVAVFTVALPRIGVVVPRILVDIATGVASIVVLIVVGKRAGWSLAGLITTSAVLTAVIGFSLQDTLGNLMGGLALQADSSIKVGDWITLGPGGPAGRVSEIRWRYTAIETRAWETVVIPN
jgi:small-conductance mechanosensitive channel